ncbi:MAG: hypothetical protein QME74_09095, partial [Candidatus Edwardsbacteria bacterium]|nr:hypothetical protein [Candidatus Edwardsbacteria bacterium]
MARHILVVRQDRLGDAINAVPVLKYLRHNQPQAKLAFTVAAGLVPLFMNQDYADEVIVYDRGMLALVSRLAHGRHDAALMLKPS